MGNGIGKWEKGNAGTLKVFLFICIYLFVSFHLDNYLNLPACPNS